MAKKHFLLPSKLVDKMPVLRKFVWMLEAAVVKSLAGLIRNIPPERAYDTANALLRRLTPLLPFTKKIRRNLTLAFPHKNKQEIEELTRGVCGNLGRAGVDLVLAQRIWQERDRRIEFVMEEGIDFGGYRDQPAVMVVGHIGAWQLSTFAAAQYDQEVTSVYAPEHNPYLKGFFLRLRSALPVHWISRDGCLRYLNKELRQGRIVGLAPDTRVDSGEFVDFFGRLMEANTSPALLALRHKCDLVPVKVERLDEARFRITMRTPIRPTDPNASTSEQVRQMTAGMFKQFETWIRETPDQWMCISRYWPQDAYEE